MPESEMPSTSPSNAISMPVPWWIRLCRWACKIAAFLGVTVILSLVVNIFSTWLTSSKGIIPVDSPFGQLLTWLLIHWPITLLVGFCCLFLALLTGVVSRWPVHNAVPLSRMQRQRVHMVGKLRTTYCTLLDQSLQEAIWMKLSFAKVPDAVQNTASLLLPTSHQTEQLLPHGTSIVQVYDGAGQELLVLGEPGAGKSTLLLKLAQELLQRATQETTHPLPVILPLSSWAVKRLPFENWLCEQLIQVYKVPRSVSVQWVQDEQILPLLDGLDEMEESARSACIAAINAYHREHSMPLVVCSCKSEYDIAAEQQRLILQDAVVVQPLTHEQIYDTYFVQAGKPVAALRRALRKNHALHELATNPLMLNILVLIYSETAVRGFSSKRALLLQQVWTTYVHRMIEQKGNAQRYPLERTCSWLHWLAQQMRKYGQSTFYLEQLQTNWLPKRQIPYYQWIIRLIMGLSGLLFGFLLNLIIGGQLYGPIGGLAWMLVFMWFFGRNTRIEPVETVAWSPNGARLGLLFGLAFGVIFKLAFELVFHALDLLPFFLITPAFGLAFTLYWGISGKQLTPTARDRLTPNESIWRSAKIGLLRGLPIGIIVGLISVMVIGLLKGLALGVFGVLLLGLQSGLLVVVKHFILRIWLWQTQVFPWNALQFLDDARARHILLRQTGGGYSFRGDRLLRDYFADLDTATPLVQAPMQPDSKPGRTKVVISAGKSQK